MMKNKEPKSYITDEPSLHMVNEAAMVYQINANPDYYNPYQMIDVARNGVSKKKLLELSTALNIDIAEMAKLLHVSLRTIQRYADDDKFDTHMSEHIMLIDRLYKKGYKMFKSPNDFNEWMNTELFAFNFEKPVSFLDTLSGVDLVYKKIGQFEQGIFA